MKIYPCCLSLFMTILNTLLSELKLLKKPRKPINYSFLLDQIGVQFLQHHDLRSNCFQQLHYLSKIQIYVLVYLPSGHGL